MGPPSFLGCTSRTGRACQEAKRFLFFSCLERFTDQPSGRQYRIFSAILVKGMWSNISMKPYLGLTVALILVGGHRLPSSLSGSGTGLSHRDSNSHLAGTSNPGMNYGQGALFPPASSETGTLRSIVSLRRTCRTLLFPPVTRPLFLSSALNCATNNFITSNCALVWWRFFDTVVE